MDRDRALSWQGALLTQGSSIEQAIQQLNDAALQILMVINSSGQFIGTITDGDIRRALLRGLSVTDSADDIVERQALVVPPDMKPDSVLQLMRANRIHQLPIVNDERRVVGLHLWDEISGPSKRSNLMVIMAGGLGTRLAPYTENCPKPLLPVAGKPMLEHIICRAKEEGFWHFILAVRYLGHMIESYFGDGRQWDVHIDYLREDEPLGTAGALSLLSPTPEQPLVITNGDIITDIHYVELLDFHIRNQAAATMAVRAHEWQHPFGVVQTKGINIVGFEEKPIIRNYVNAGVYVLSPEAIGYLERNVRCDMPTLFERMRLKNERVVAYPMHEPWLDVGRTDDYDRASLAVEQQSGNEEK